MQYTYAAQGLGMMPGTLKSNSNRIQDYWFVNSPLFSEFMRTISNFFYSDLQNYSHLLSFILHFSACTNTSLVVHNFKGGKQYTIQIFFFSLFFYK